MRAFVVYVYTQRLVNSLSKFLKCLILISFIIVVVNGNCISYFSLSFIEVFLRDKRCYLFNGVFKWFLDCCVVLWIVDCDLWMIGISEFYINLLFTILYITLVLYN